MPRVFDARALNSVRHTLAVTLPYPPRNLPVLQMPDNAQDKPFGVLGAREPLSANRFANQPVPEMATRAGRRR